MNTIADSPTHRTHNGQTVGLYGTTPAPVPTPAILPTLPALPEAACSVNLFFEVAAGYGKAQATGRGATAQEAVGNLKATIEATRAALAPSKPTVASLLACGLGKATTRQDWSLVERLAKGAALVLSGAVEPGNREGLWAVRSQSNPLNFYEVDSVSCTCPDARHHAKEGETYYCKHLLAALFVVKMQDQVIL